VRAPAAGEVLGTLVDGGAASLLPAAFNPT
jgi:hypothetical protein